MELMVKVLEIDKSPRVISVDRRVRISSKLLRNGLKEGAVVKVALVEFENGDKGLLLIPLTSKLLNS